jgi:urease accessory protein
MAQRESQAYASGFVAATALLHAGGYALVRFLPTAAAPLARIAGIGTASTWVWWLAS